MSHVQSGRMAIYLTIIEMLKFSFTSGIGGYREVNGILIVQNFNNDWSNAQRVMFDSDGSSGSEVMQKRRMKEILVPEIWMKPNSDNYFQCIARPRNRIRWGQ